MKINTDIESCLTILNRGGLILYPTDTIWGIGCDATNEMAISRVYQLKQRHEEKSMIILLSDPLDVPKYTDGDFPGLAEYLKGENKPVTVVYGKAKNLPRNLINKAGSIAIRLVKNDFCKQLIDYFGKPILSTSANMSGYPSPVLFADISKEIKSGVDYVVQQGRDDINSKSSSKVIKWHEDGSYIIIRD